MKRLTNTFLITALMCGPGVLLAQQQSPKQSGPPQNQQDVPHQQPGTNNPDLGSQRNPSPDTSTNGGTGTGSGTQSKKKAKRNKHGSTSSQTTTSSR